MEEFIFERLDVWQKSRQLVIIVYKLLEHFPRTEQYALCDQIRRAVISVPSNIAEGAGRMSVKEKIHFAEISYGSLMETFCQLTIACDLNYITQADLNSVRPLVDEVARMLSGMRKSLKSRIEA